jgi:hypothetical protein
MRSTAKDRLKYVDLWHTLLECVPEFKPIFADDVAFNGEILSHGLFEALFKLTSKAYDEGNMELFKRVFDFINEAAMSDDEDVLGPVHISFMERVPYHPLNQAAKDLLNPAAREMYDAIVNWKP